MGKPIGVFPVHNNKFEFSTTGRGENATYKEVKDLENFGLSFDNGVEEWTPLDAEGWVRRLMTAKSVTISFTGKRNVGDEGNDYIASVVFKNGSDCNSALKWTMPDETVIEMDCVLDVKNVGGGDSTNVAPLEFDALSDGKPEVTLPTTTTTTE